MEQTRQKRTAKVFLVAVLTFVVTLATVFAILPTATLSARAEGTTVDLSALTEAYTAQNGDTLTGTLGGNYRITIASGATVTLKDVTINSTMHAGLTCNGATLILKGKNTVRSSAEYCPGILVTDYSRLTISGDGSLDVYGAENAAGIGGRFNTDCGTIVIESGTITAHGGTSGAGIGSGNYSACSGIEISGGIVKAYGGEDGGAGIGTGAYASYCAYINISGGRIYAQGTVYEDEWGSAGIGTGVSSSISSGNSTCEKITITGGNIEAVGGPGAAAIGAGSGYKFYDVEMEEEYSSTSECDEILITDGVGKLKATKGNGSPQTIGGGKISRCVWGVKVLGGGAVTESPYTYLSSGPAGVIVLIDEIPNPVVVNDNCKNAIAKAREAYNKLATDEDREKVTNYSVLTAAEAVFAVEEINQMIDALPAVEEITIDNKEDVKAAVEKYEALGDQKNLIDEERVTKLTEAKEKIDAVDQEIANEVKEQIDDLPATEEITANDKETIEEARDAYDALDEEQLAKLPEGTLEKLEAAESAVEIAVVIDLIDDLPATEEITANDKETIEAARDAYDALDEEQLAKLPEGTLEKLEAAEQTLRIVTVERLINDLSNETFTLENLDEVKEKIDAAREAYDDLSTEEKNSVTNYSTLTDAESAYSCWKVLALIQALPERLEDTEACREAIEEARVAYDALPRESKAQIPSSDKAVLFKAEAFVVDLTIEEIGEVEYTADTKEKIDEARAAYEQYVETLINTYTDSQANQEAVNQAKAYVEKYDALTTAEATYKALGVKELIANIGTVEYSDETKERIDAAKEAYEALNSTEKALVDNATVLTTAESTYATLKTNSDAAAAVKELIANIGEVEYNAETKGKIDAAKEAYDNLTPEQQALVNNVEDLTAAEQTYSAKAAAANKGLSGGAIAGIVIGVIFGAIILACGVFALVWFVVKKKNMAELKTAVSETADKAKAKLSDLKGKMKKK